MQELAEPAWCRAWACGDGSQLACWSLRAGSGACEESVPGCRSLLPSYCFLPGSVDTRQACCLLQPKRGQEPVQHCALL